MTRALAVCPRHGCPSLVQPGAHHTCPLDPATCPQRPWRGSTRRKRLPRDWERRRARILKRDHGTCHVCGKPGADQVDHVIPGDDHRETNLAAIHSVPCHREKTAREAIAGRIRR